MVGIRWDKKVTNAEIKKTGVEDIRTIIKTLKWNFAGHMVREEGKNGMGG